MRQLTALDQQFLALEGSRQYGHVGGLAILDPSTAPRGTSMALISYSCGPTCTWCGAATACPKAPAIFT